LARDTNATTKEIHSDTTAIKEDTTQILSEIARLQASLPGYPNGSDDVVLRRYLEELTSYTEAELDSSSTSHDDHEPSSSASNGISSSIPRLQGHQGLWINGEQSLGAQGPGTGARQYPTRRNPAGPKRSSQSDQTERSSGNGSEPERGRRQKTPPRSDDLLHNNPSYHEPSGGHDTEQGLEDDRWQSGFTPTRSFSSVGFPGPRGPSGAPPIEPPGAMNFFGHGGSIPSAAIGRGQTFINHGIVVGSVRFRSRYPCSY
jgi:hypothetical protein